MPHATFNVNTRSYIPIFNSTADPLWKFHQHCLMLFTLNHVN